MDRLKRRADFLAVAKGARIQAGPFLLQSRDRRDRKAPRIGFTVTKKTGNAVERNRIRRRLRAAAAAVVPGAAKPGYDYVIVARRAALTVPFATMLEDLDRALARSHHSKNAGQGPDRPAKARKPAGDGETDD
jgi:ribonuclease P protein component